MIKFSNPYHGWITMSIQFNDNDVLEIDFSDVGPNSIMELQAAAMLLKTGQSFSTVEFFHEPAEAVLKTMLIDNKFKIDYSIDGKSICSSNVNRQEYVESLLSELRRVIPLCKNHNWTHDEVKLYL